MAAANIASVNSLDTGKLSLWLEGGIIGDMVIRGWREGKRRG